jgi:hypothetical protein
VKGFTPTFSHEFECIERKSFHAGLLEGLREAKRYLEFVSAINATSTDCVCLKADASNKLDYVNGLIDNLKLESMK